MSFTVASQGTAIITWVSLLGPVLSLNEPCMQWPFSNYTNACDVKSGIDAEYPKLNACLSFQNGPPDFDFQVLQFNGGGQSYATIRTWKLNEEDKVSFAILVYPETEYGVIFYFEADTKKDDTIHTMMVELKNKNVQLTMKDERQSNVVDMKVTLDETLHKWLLISINKKDNTYTLRVNNQIAEVSGKKIPFHLDGWIHISKYKDMTTSLKGLFCCLAIWEDYIEPKIAVSDIRYFMKKNYLSNKCQVGVPKCIPPVVKIDTKILQLWPLSVSSNGNGVINETEPIAPLDSLCLRSMTVYNATNQSVIYFDGSVLSYIKAPMPDQTLSGDVTIAIAVMPDDLAEGVVWDYVTSANRPGDVQRITLRLLNRRDVQFDVRNEKGTCGTVMIREPFLGSTWSFVSANYQVTKDSISLLVNSATSAVVKTTCKPSSAPNTNGSISIGQSNTNTTSEVGYHGSTACLTIVRGVFDANSIKTLVLNTCLADGNKKQHTRSSGCSKRTEMHGKKFRLVASGSCPYSITARHNYTVRTLLECSRRCIECASCRSFAFKPVILQINCMTYDIVTRNGLADDNMCKYYTVSLG